METLNNLTSVESPLTLAQQIAHWAAHGQAVSKAYQEMACDWSNRFAAHPLLLAWFESYAFKDLQAYHLNHDCAKPFCAQFNEQTGRYSYGADHSEKSAALAQMLGVDAQSCHLIAHDMAFHLAREATIAAAWALPGSDDLYATAWAELYANAALFGGQESDSFKIKQKRLLWALKHCPLPLPALSTKALQASPMNPLSTGTHCHV